MNIPKKSVFETSVFQVGSEVYTWKDVFVSAGLRGEWDRLLETTQTAVLCQMQFEATEEELEQAAEEFRYKHDLITAEEMETWLGKWDLSLEEWMGYVERRLLLENNGDEVEKGNEDDAENLEEVLSALEVDGICSGEFIRFAHQLAGQAAVQNGTDQWTPASEEAVEQSRRFLSEDLKGYEGIDRLIRLQLGFESFRLQCTRPEKIQEHIQSHLMDFIRFRLRSMTFDEEGLALEAAMCAREDGDTATMVSSLAKARLNQRDCFLNDLEAEVRNSVTAAKPGEFVGPLKTSEEKFVLIQVVAKHSPSADHPEVRARAENEVIQGVLRYHINNQVQWHMRL